MSRGTRRQEQAAGADNVFQNNLRRRVALSCLAEDEN